MTNPTNPAEPFTPFLPATFNIPEEQDRLSSFLVDTFSSITDVLNDKKIGMYVQTAENFNGNKYFYKTTGVTRNGYQTIAYIPSYPNTSSLVLTSSSNPQFPLTNVNNEFVVTHVWGSASKPPTTAGTGDYFSFMAQGDSRISFTLSDTTLTITTTVDMSAYSGFIAIEYLRNGV